MIIAVDYGKSLCGLAVSYEGKLAEPLCSVKTEKVIQKIKSLNPDMVIVGISAGESANLALGFAKEVENMLGLKTELVDETLTTIEARQITNKKDDNAIAAAIILERFLENV
ncbi:hypothetical protein A2872_03850 [Candidatus Gottesmanbacteria bacterium RIFCSPHIGHO2_01_FULL_42_12]|uniref:YqgF/RNase H-like domain-containing protein n=1 Tax=Candidatus Gottesmanbacteria bacterium RIFCSPHIGHO2_01_FULL_42_12 TaxID=1798377 RepID=A0A1F5Z4M0_9BACT|nr:MAG: hypothetical protein A2872_03850 [Candidatus Gottesmanbacteria bacterium RIFCSPHIGHO2_01_FULL_42_12]